VIVVVLNLRFRGDRLLDMGGDARCHLHSPATTSKEEKFALLSEVNNERLSILLFLLLSDLFFLASHGSILPGEVWEDMAS
jgi:hypothetical protein